MTVNDAVKRVKDRSHKGDVDVTTDETTNQILRAINDARRDVINRTPKDWLRKTGSFATVSGTSTYSLASDSNGPLFFRYTTSNTDYFPKKIDTEREFYQKIYNSNTSNNKPRYYFDAGRDSSGYHQIILFPTPDAAYTINYVYMKDPTLTDISSSDFNTQIPDVDTANHDVIWKGALYYFLKNFDDPLQLVAKKDYDEALQTLDDANDEDLDTDLQFRWDISKFNSLGDSGTNTGIRLV